MMDGDEWRRLTGNIPALSRNREILLT